MFSVRVCPYQGWLLWEFPSLHQMLECMKRSVSVMLN
jgi:hypothetical protein